MVQSKQEIDNYVEELEVNLDAANAYITELEKDNVEARAKLEAIRNLSKLKSEALDGTYSVNETIQDRHRIRRGYIVVVYSKIQRIGLVHSNVHQFFEMETHAN
jgi:hypothetical protein